MTVALRFAPNEAEEAEGLSDAGIETYRADPFPAVARETSQNSRDAHDRERCPGLPVRMVIERLEIPRQALPSLGEYQRAVEACLQVAEAAGQQKLKERAFFEQARQVLSRPTIPILRIADFNTTGLRGPCEDGTPFHSLVKSSGVSHKAEDTAGGSFGIGKSAVYAASDLQTVFYSTLYLTPDGRSHFLCQGKTKFTSFRDESGSSFRSVGYWGHPDRYMPVEDPALAPEWLRRDEVGTTVCSIAVRDADDWHREMLAAILVNFFPAIHRGEMEFTVGDIKLDSVSLRKLFDDQTLPAAMRPGGDDEFRFARSMFECFTNSEDVVARVVRIDGVGDFRIRLLVRDGLPKRLGFLRNGMYICDNLSHFGDRFARFAMYRDFIGVVEPESHSASAWLRKIENPKHDEFSPERLLTASDRKEATRAGRQLVAAIREEVKSAAKPETEGDTNLDELSEFFALESAPQAPDDDLGERDLRRGAVRKVEPSRPRRALPPSAQGNGEEGGAGNQRGTHVPARPGNGPGPGDGKGGTGTAASGHPFVVEDIRTVIPAGTDGTIRTVYFTPAESGSASLGFLATGLQTPEELATETSHESIECKAGVRIRVEVRFARPYSGPLQVVCLSAQE